MRKEHDAAQNYQRAAALERAAGRDRIRRAAAAYRDLANAFKETRAGKKAAADFERLRKEF